MKTLKSLLLVTAMIPTVGIAQSVAPAQQAVQVPPTAPTGRPAPAIMERFDVNKDGKIDGQERQAVVAAMRNRFDTNGDGQLDQQEKQAAAQAMQARQGAPGAPNANANNANATNMNQMHLKILERFDANRDGKLDDAEKAKAKAVMDQKRQEMLQIRQKFDSNGDGKLDDAEKAAARQAMGKGPGVGAAQGAAVGSVGGSPIPR